MRNLWIDEVLRRSIDTRTVLTGRAEWIPAGSDPVRGRAQLILCRSGQRRFVGMTISRFGRIVTRGLFDCADIVVQSSASDHINMAIATNSDRRVSLLRFDGRACDRIATFATV